MDRVIDFLTLVWGERPGWVDIPSKSGGHWTPFSAEWPDDQELVRRRVESCLEDEEDVYFSVAQFQQEGRRLKDTLPSFWLWADLDTVDPVVCAEFDLTPTVCWESSPFRYQALWRMEQALSPEVLAKLNRALSYAIGADKGGWDLTQVLRPVGTRNMKYPNHPEVMMVYEDGPEYDARQVWKQVKDFAEKPAVSVRARTVHRAGEVPARARALLATPIDRVVVGERSSKLWELNMLLAENGMDEEEIYELVVGSAWNKWGNSASGERKIREDIRRALERVERRTGIPVGTGNGHKPPDLAASTLVEPVIRPEELELEEFDLAAPSEEAEARAVHLPFVGYSSFMAQNLEAPRWLIQDLWMAQSHGIIGGEAKSSKSLLAMAMGLSIASGCPFLGLEQFAVSTPGPVLMVQEENTPWDVQDKLRKLARLYGLIGKSDIERSPAEEGAVARQTVRLSFPTDAPLLLLNNFGFNMGEEEYRDALEDTIQREAPVMVILDPLYLMLGDADADRSHEVRHFQRWLLSLRYTYGTAIVLVHHFGKPRAEDNRRWGHRLLGSGTWYNWVDSAMYAEALEPGVDWYRGGPRVKVNRHLKIEREWRSAPPQDRLALRMHMGGPGSLRMIVQVQEGMTMPQLIHKAVKEAGEEGILLTELASGLSIDRRTVRKYTVGSGRFRVEGTKRGRGQSYRIYELAKTDA